MGVLWADDTAGRAVTVMEDDADSDELVVGTSGGLLTCCSGE